MELIKNLGVGVAKINVETPYLTTEVKTILAIIGGVLGALTGGMDGLLYGLIVLMVVDYFSGVILAIVNQKMSSRIGAKGIAKKCYILMFVVVGNIVDTRIFGQGSICRAAVISFYSVNELSSIIENAGNLGLPVPKKLMDILVQIKQENRSSDLLNEEVKVSEDIKENYSKSK